MSTPTHNWWPFLLSKILSIPMSLIITFIADIIFKGTAWVGAWLVTQMLHIHCKVCRGLLPSPVHVSLNIVGPTVAISSKARLLKQILSRFSSYYQLLSLKSRLISRLLLGNFVWIASPRRLTSSTHSRSRWGILIGLEFSCALSALVSLIRTYLLLNGVVVCATNTRLLG